METLPDPGDHVIFQGQSHWVKSINPAVDDEVQLAQTPAGGGAFWAPLRLVEYPRPAEPKAMSPSQVRDRMTTGEAEALCRMVATIADALGIGDDNPTVKMARWNVTELDLWRKP